MNGSVKELISVLLKEETLHNQLIKIATAMKSAIMNNESSAVILFSQKFDEITAQIIDLEKSRLNLSDTIACALLPNPIHLNLREIINLIENKDLKKELTLRRSMLKKAISKFSEINSDNTILLQEKISDIDSNVKIIMENVRKPAAYNKSGSMSKNRNESSLFNTTA